MKIKLVTLILIIVLLIGGGTGAYFLLKDKDLGIMKTSKNNNGIIFNNVTQENTEETKNQISNSITEEKISQDIKQISKTNAEKIQINEKLADKLYYVMDDLNENEIVGNKIISYDQDLLNNEAVKYYIVWETIPKSSFEYDKDVNGNEVDGAANVSCKIFNQYYKSIFGKEADFEKIKELNIKYGITIKNNTIYGSRPTGRGEPEFALKVDSVVYDANQEIYTIKINYLKFSNDKTITSKEIEGISKPSTLTWNEKLNYAKLEIQYKKDNNENYKLLSMILKEELTNKNTQTNTSSSDKTITSNELKTIINNQSEGYDYARVTSISKNNNNSYLIEADIYNAIRISQTQYDKMVKDKKIILNNIEYPYYKLENEDEDGLTMDWGYGYIVDKDGLQYGATKDGNQYVFYREIGGVCRIINKKERTIKFTLAGNTSVWVQASSYEDMTLDECYADENLKNIIRDLDNTFVTLGYNKEINVPIIVVDPR